MHGIVRRTSSFNTKRITGLNTQNLYLHYGDLTDATSCLQIVTDVQPSEVYNLGAQYCNTKRLEPRCTNNTLATACLPLILCVRTPSSCGQVACEDVLRDVRIHG